MLSVLHRRLRPPRRVEPMVEPVPPRPPGPLLWVHLGPGADPRAVALAVDDLRRRRPEVFVLASGFVTPPDGAVVVSAPPDTRGAVRRFLRRWSPDALFWTGNDPAPTLWDAVLSQGLPVVAAEIDPTVFPVGQARDMTRFDLVQPIRPDPRLGPAAADGGRLCPIAPPPPVRADDLAELVEAIASRPVWLAADVPPEELDLVLAIHERALRLSHRLLLILSLRAAAPHAFGSMHAARRSIEGVPGREAQIFLADDEDDTSLWVRLAAITYLGGSLSGTGPETSPMLPAALGSAVLHGPRMAPFQTEISRLHRARAARRAADAAELGALIEQLQEPKAVADLAHAAWIVSSDGADATARVVACLADALGERDPV